MTPARRRKIAKALGGAIRARRLSAGLTQRALCERLDQEPNHLGEAENGRKIPQMPQLFELAKALGCSCADLVRDAEQAL